MKINVAFAFDGKLWLQSAVSIYSLSLHTGGDRYNIYCLIDTSVHNAMCDVIRNVVKHNRRIKIHFLRFDADILKNNCYDDGTARFPRVAMARLFLPNMLPHQKKILWLDSDIIVCDNLSGLYKTNLTGNFIAAIRDTGMDEVIKMYPKEFKHYDEYGLTEMVQRCEYVNSGVLLMNLREMRAYGWTERCLERISSEKRNIWYFDQDVINSVSRGHIKYVSPRYNRMTKINLQNAVSAYQRAGLPTESIIDGFFDCVILHYAGTQKPWRHEGPYWDVWTAYGQLSGLF